MLFGGIIDGGSIGLSFGTHKVVRIAKNTKNREVSNITVTASPNTAKLSITQILPHLQAAPTTGA
jgi:hypothetical protein